MKKILAIAPYKYLPFFSGGQKFIARFFEHLGENAGLIVISVAENDLSLAKNYRIIPLLKSSFSRYIDRSLYKKILEIISREKFETIIWEHPYYTWLAIRLKKKTGITTIIHTHNIEYQRFRSLGKWWWPVLRIYEKRFFKKADKILFITPEDKEFAIKRWKIDESKCLDLPFGTELNSHPGDRENCRKEINSRYNIPGETKILFFNGLLDYKPNLEALRVILNDINPLLLKKTGFNYKILIAGKNLPREFGSLTPWLDKNVIYTGFISEIGNYYKASDIFLNPVQSGGGIKTKMVESIAYGTTVVSTETGATGIEKSVCGEKLVVVKNNDWETFTEQVVKFAFLDTITPPAYYEKYNWSSLVKNVVKNLS